MSIVQPSLMVIFKPAEIFFLTPGQTETIFFPWPDNDSDSYKSEIGYVVVESKILFHLSLQNK